MRPHATLASRQIPTASLRPGLRVGNTVYVAARVLHLRRQPRAQGPAEPGLYVPRNARGTVVALPNRNWVRVLFTSEDVGVDGYVSHWYLTKEKPQPSN